MRLSVICCNVNVLPPSNVIDGIDKELSPLIAVNNCLSANNMNRAPE